MTPQEIKQAIDEGKTVCWVNKGYHVVKDALGQYLIVFIRNMHCIGLTWKDGITLNGKEHEFFISKNEQHEKDIYRTIE